MDVISNRPLREFAENFPAASTPLQVWRKTLERSSPANFAELRQIFGSVDRVGEMYVFDIKGNHCRLVCFVNFKAQRCYVRHVMTHTEYDRGKWK